MAATPTTLADALAGLATANQALRRVLEDNALALSEALGSCASEPSASDILNCRDVMEGQARSDRAMAELFEARRCLRRFLVGAALDEGMPVPRVAVLLGIRPDLVQTYASERA